MKMFNINADTYAESCVHTKNVIKKDNKPILWIKMHDIQDNLCAKNMSGLTIKAIKGIYNTKTLTDKKISAYKKHGSELIDGEKFMYIHKSWFINSHELQNTNSN